jgi:hypothetical protein
MTKVHFANKDGQFVSIYEMPRNGKPDSNPVAPTIFPLVRFP